MGRRYKYTKDYETRVEMKGNKKVETLIYKGKYYKFDISDAKFKRLKLVYILFSCLFFIAFVFIGLLNTNGSRQFYIILPYLFTFLPIFYEIMGTIKLLKSESKLTFVEYDTSVSRIRRSTIGILVFSMTSVIGEIIYLMSNKITDISSLEYTFLSGVLFLTISSFLFLQLQNKYKCSEI